MAETPTVQQPVPDDGLRSTLVSQLEQSYETIRHLYSIASQWTGLMVAAWAALTVLGFSPVSAVGPTVDQPSTPLVAQSPLATTGPSAGVTVTGSTPTAGGTVPAVQIPINRAALLVGGILLLVLSYLLQRVGKSIAGVMVSTLSLEHKLGIALSDSIATTYVAAFRGNKLVETFRSFVEGILSGREQDWLRTLATDPKYSLLSIRNSKTEVVLVMGGVAQILLAVALIAIPSLW